MQQSPLSILWRFKMLSIEVRCSDLWLDPFYIIDFFGVDKLGRCIFRFQSSLQLFSFNMLFYQEFSYIISLFICCVFICVYACVYVCVWMSERDSFIMFSKVKILFMSLFFPESIFSWRMRTPLFTQCLFGCNCPCFLRVLERVVRYWPNHTF